MGEKISEFEDLVIDPIQNEAKGGKKKSPGKNEQSISDLQENTLTWYDWSLRGREERGEQKKNS